MQSILQYGEWRLQQQQQQELLELNFEIPARFFEGNGESSQQSSVLHRSWLKWVTIGETSEVVLFVEMLKGLMLNTLQGTLQSHDVFWQWRTCLHSPSVTGNGLILRQRNPQSSDLLCNGAISVRAAFTKLWMLKDVREQTFSESQRVPRTSRTHAGLAFWLESSPS